MTEYNRSSDPDAIAFAADWKAVMEDLAKAAYEVGRQIGESTNAIEPLR